MSMRKGTPNSAIAELETTDLPEMTALSAKGQVIIPFVGKI